MVHYKDYGRIIIPSIALGIGVVIKLIINLTLIPIPEIGVNGAAIGSLVCNIIAALISVFVLMKSIDLKIDILKFIIKPVLAVSIMGITSYYVYRVLEFGKLGIIISIVVAVIVYFLLIIILRIIKFEEIKIFLDTKKRL